MMALLEGNEEMGAVILQAADVNSKACVYVHSNGYSALSWCMERGYTGLLLRLADKVTDKEKWRIMKEAECRTFDVSLPAARLSPSFCRA